MSETLDIMHFHDLPERLLGSRTRIAVLKALLRNSGAEWTGRELSREAKVSPSQAISVLRALESEGVCHQRRVGRASVWSIDPDHFITRELISVLRLDETAKGRLAKLLEDALEGSGAEEAYLFGSVVSGREEASSDIDFVVVFRGQKEVEAWQKRLETLRSRVQKEFANFLSPLVYARAQVRRGGARRILEEARRTGAMVEVPRWSRRPPSQGRTAQAERVFGPAFQREIRAGRADARAGRVHTTKELRKELGL